MKNVLGLTLVFCLFSVMSFAQSSGEPLEYGARAQGMGNATVTMDGTWALFHNQAGIARMESIGGGAFYQSRFSLQELSTAGFGAAIPAAGGVFGLSYVRYGYTAYREQRVGLAYARTLGEKLDVGVQFDYIGIFLGGSYGSSSSFTFQGGAIYQASEKIEIAFHVFNPVRAALAEFNDERLPVVLRAGASYLFSERVAIRGEVRKHIDYDPSLAIGLEYELIENLFLRGGVSGAPSRFAFGAGYRLGALQLDISSGYNEVLGYSPQLSFTYHGK
ncbi:MAG: hypothetical protein MK081_01625 [Flavobacteriales bacterium]|nr:hypothetical protein [Flavobacteriales bacterium]